MTTTVTKLPLPQIVCDDCGGTCIYEKEEKYPDDAAWLVCTGCGREWDDLGSAIQRQDAFIDSATATIEELAKETVKPSNIHEIAPEPRRLDSDAEGHLFTCLGRLLWAWLLVMGIVMLALGGWGLIATAAALDRGELWTQVVAGILFLVAFLVILQGIKKQ